MLFKQGYAQFVFQLGDGVVQVRLADVQRLRCPAVVLIVGDGLEVTDVVEVHTMISFFTCRGGARPARCLSASCRLPYTTGPGMPGPYKS